ncbi:hypothetical protein [Phormidesmis priestleyi]
MKFFTVFWRTSLWRGRQNADLFGQPEELKSKVKGVILALLME